MSLATHDVVKSKGQDRSLMGLANIERRYEGGGVKLKKKKFGKKIICLENSSILVSLEIARTENNPWFIEILGN